MTTSTEVERLTVGSCDGVDLAVWVDGQGPPLVLVHGSIQDHTISAALVGELRGHFTKYAMDRGGFGTSGSVPSYSLDREFADKAPRHAIQVGLVDVRNGKGLGLEQGPPRIGCGDLVHQLLAGLAERVGDVGVEPAPGSLLRHGERSPGPTASRKSTACVATAPTRAGSATASFTMPFGPFRPTARTASPRSPAPRGPARADGPASKPHRRPRSGSRSRAACHPRPPWPPPGPPQPCSPAGAQRESQHLAGVAEVRRLRRLT